MIGSRLSRVTLLLLLTGVMAAPVATQQAPPQGTPSAPGAPSAPSAGAAAAGTRKPPKLQTRPSAVRVAVDPKLVTIDDGDTLEIRWPTGDLEEVRILGIDCPETRHLPHDLPYAQPFGDEARAFALGTFATATTIELLRATTVDPYDRTLAYVFVDNKNYSVLVINARLAEETITAFGDNGFPNEAAVVVDAAKRAGPLPFEPPYQYRNRMRRVSEWMKGKGIYPTQ